MKTGGLRGRESFRADSIEMPEYSKKDLHDFGRWLEGFKVEKQVKNWNTGEMDTIHPINMQEAMVAFGAMSKRMHLGVPTYSVKVAISEVNGHRAVVRPTKQDLFEHKYDEWSKMNGRKEYAKEKEGEEYEKMAAQVVGDMQVEYTPEEMELVPEPQF